MPNKSAQLLAPISATAEFYVPTTARPRIALNTSGISIPEFELVYSRKKNGWGDKWDASIDVWLDFERAASAKKWQKAFPTFDNPKVCPPVELGMWDAPDTDRQSSTIFSSLVASVGCDINGFGKTWWAWWARLQPDDRPHKCSNGEKMLAPRDGPYTWTTLCKSGKKGMFLVMAALVWWGSAVHDSLAQGDVSQRDIVENWAAAVDEVTWALQEMTHFAGAGGSKKRK